MLKDGAEDSYLRSARIQSVERLKSAGKARECKKEVQKVLKLNWATGRCHSQKYGSENSCPRRVRANTAGMKGTKRQNVNPGAEKFFSCCLLQSANL